MRQTLVQSVTTITLVVVSILLNDVVLSFQPVSRILISTTTRNNQGLFSFLLQSTMNSDATSSNDEKRQTSEKVTQEKSIEKKRDDEKLAMPWSDIQNEALRDNIAKYTVMIPLKAEDESKEGEQSQVFALWRTMLKDVPEIAGYPIDFLQQMHARQIQNSETLLEVTPALLPYLEDYEFAAAGGVSGKIYGVPGLADGTRIETSQVTNIEVTLPQGFVRTSDGLAAYEVGRPKREEFSNGDTISTSLRTGGELLKNVQNTGSSIENISVEDADGMLARLGATTGILLAGATAINMLSHHLTVNVFWV